MTAPKRGIGFTLSLLLFLGVFAFMLYTLLTLSANDADYATLSAQSPLVIGGFIACMIIGIIGVALTWLRRRAGVYLVLAGMIAFFLLAAALDMIRGTIGLQLIGGFCGFALLWYQFFYAQHKQVN